jgi:hypothetical protein
MLINEKDLGKMVLRKKELSTVGASVWPAKDILYV